MSLKIKNIKNEMTHQYTNGDKIIAHHFSMNYKISPQNLQKIIDTKFKNKVGYKFSITSLFSFGPTSSNRTDHIFGDDYHVIHAGDSSNINPDDKIHGFVLYEIKKNKNKNNIKK